MPTNLHTKGALVYTDYVFSLLWSVSADVPYFMIVLH